MTCVVDFTIRAGTDEYVDFVLQFGPKWTGPEDDGDPIPRSRVAGVDFYIKDSPTDENYILQLADGDDSEIEWLNETDGEIAVKIGDNADNDMADKNLYWELKLTFDTGERITLGYGRCAITASLENGV